MSSILFATKMAYYSIHLHSNCGAILDMIALAILSAVKFNESSSNCHRTSVNVELLHFYSKCKLLKPSHGASEITNINSSRDALDWIKNLATGQK